MSTPENSRLTNAIREARRLIGFMTNEKIGEAARVLDAATGGNAPPTIMDACTALFEIDRLLADTYSPSRRELERLHEMLHKARAGLEYIYPSLATPSDGAR